MISTKENKPILIKGVEEIAKSLRSNKSSPWLNNFRKENLSRFKELGIPTAHDEEWKYTNLSRITTHHYGISTTNTLPEEELADFNLYCSKKEFNIVFVNGIFSKDLSSLKNLPKGITVTTFKDALPQYETEIKNLLLRHNANEQTPFIALNNALVEDGVFIKIADKAILKNLIHVVHITSSQNSEILSLPKTIILLEKSSEATILESHVSFNDKIIYFANALTDIFIGENATLHYCKAQKESQKAFHIGHTRIWQEQNSNLDGLSVMTAAALARNNLDVFLNGEGANSKLCGLYSLFGEQLADNHTFVDHRFPNCISNQFYKGILNDASHAVFNGKIFVHPKAQKTNSYQLNKNLLLGKNCRIDTKPQLEIFADDVKCTHGATIGQLNEEEIFYLQTRCIPRREAIKMLSHGFVEDLLNTVASESVNQKLHKLLQPSFAHL